jgi:vacuolar-type H+-ATPase subunit H
MADSRIKGRVKGLLGSPTQMDELPPDPPEPMYAPPSFADAPIHDPEAQRRALQVLTLAQRTADEHIASAQQQAEQIIGGARGSAEQLAQQAQAHAEGVRREAEKALVDARAKATEIVTDAQTNAANLDREAQERYDDVVGSLETKRAALQQRIENLQQFDRDYRARLRMFMQGQLEALDHDEPPPAQAQAMAPAASMAPAGGPPVGQPPAQPMGPPATLGQPAGPTRIPSRVQRVPDQ